jgi:hypothetical protein
MRNIFYSTLAMLVIFAVTPVWAGSTLPPGVQIGTTAGTPSTTNGASIVVDTTDNQFWFNNPATGWKTAVLNGTSASIGGSALVAGACASGTATVTGAATTMAVASSPVTYPGDGFDWHSYVAAAGTVTVKVCAIVAGTPAASAYNVRVLE